MKQFWRKVSKPAKLLSCNLRQFSQKPENGESRDFEFTLHDLVPKDNLAVNKPAEVY